MKKLEIPKVIWEDKKIPKETKYVYAYIYAKGYDKEITDINVGGLQRIIKINNKFKEKSWEIRKIKISNLQRVCKWNVYNNT